MADRGRQNIELLVYPYVAKQIMPRSMKNKAFSPFL